MKLWQKTIIALFLGVIVGLLFQDKVLWLKALGDSYLSLIQMVLIPLVFSSISVGICNVQDSSKLGRVGLMMFLLYGCTTLVGVVEGMGVASLFQPGSGIQLGVSLDPVSVSPTSLALSDILARLIPKNGIKAFLDGNVIQVILIAALLGVAVNLCKEQAKPLKDVLNSFSKVMFLITRMVVAITPIGVFAIIGWTVATLGVKAFVPMFRFLLLYYAVCLLHLIIVYVPLIKWSKVSIKHFFASAWDAIVMAFSTCSSSATLPVLMNIATERLKIAPRIAHFMLPIGTSMNMNGCAIFQGLGALFLCQLYGIDLSLAQMVTMVLVAVISAAGAAGVPGTGFIMLTLVLSSVGIPLEGMALLAGIDRLRDMISTVLNILGDLVCTLAVARKEGEMLDTPSPVLEISS